MPSQVSASPELMAHLSRLGRSHHQVAALQDLLVVALRNMEWMHEEVQMLQLQQTQGQVGSVLQMFQAQTAQLHSTQQQVQELQDFADQARISYSRASSLQDSKLQQTQAQVDGLQAKLQATLAVQLQLRSELAAESERQQVRADEAYERHRQLAETVAAQQQPAESEDRSPSRLALPMAPSPAPDHTPPQAVSPPLERLVPDAALPRLETPSPPPGALERPTSTCNSLVSSDNPLGSAPNSARDVAGTMQRIFSLEAELRLLIAGCPEAEILIGADEDDADTQADWRSQEEWV